MIDSHCHLYFDKLKNNLDLVIKRAKKNGVTGILSINTQQNEFFSHLNLINKYKSIFISYGIHPENIKSNNIPSVKDLLKFCSNNRVIGIGETGLDFYHSIDYKKEQYIAFENHIECSFKTNLPLIIHQRNSENEIIDVLKNYQKTKSLKVIFHCFTGSNKLRDFCLENNFYISLSGIITFKNANELRGVIKSIPLKNILIETDSPFLAPAPLRGKINEPSYVKYIAQYLADFYKISLKDFTQETDNNFYNLFSKAIRYKEISE